MTTAILYGRYSPRKQVAGECESIETQMHYCQEYCKTKGYTVESEHSDASMSGNDEDRPGLWDAIHALKKGYILVVFKLDRLARDVYLSEYIHREAKKAKASIEAVQGGSNGDTPEQVLIRQVFQAFAEYERKIIGIRTKYAMLRHQKAGRCMSRHPPYGYAREGKLLKMQPEEQEIIKVIEGLANEGYCGNAIKTRLTSEGITCRGGKWYHSTIGHILERVKEF